MLVKYWMSTNVITIDEDVSMMEASRLMKQHGIQHLPVMREGRLAGIVSDRDLKEAQPSKASTLDIYELYYLLDQLKVKEIMAQKLRTAHPDDTIEKAAALMLKHDISALPVVNDEGHLEGIITKGDLFRALVSISGIYQAGAQVGFELPDQPGSIMAVADVIRDHGGRIVSIISSYEHAPEGFRHVYVRFKGRMKRAGLIAELEKKFKVLYHTHDKVE
jgi:acetoin utilization protein AcuB